MVKIKFGPTGLGSLNEAKILLEEYSKKGLEACEVPFTYRVYLDKNQAKEIGAVANDLGIRLSIHAPYYINLNSKEKEKIEASKKRILDCCEIGDYFNEGDKTKIVFHAGFYSNMDKEETYQNIKKEIKDMLKEIKKRKLNVELCPEIMGKINVFGSIEEISRLVRETGCGYCIDFAHVLARYDKNHFDLIEKSFLQKEWHCHFSGIIYGDKGEKKHRLTDKEEWKNLFNFLRKLDKDVTIICESPDPFGDSVNGYELFFSSDK